MTVLCFRLSVRRRVRTAGSLHRPRHLGRAARPGPRLRGRPLPHRPLPPQPRDGPGRRTAGGILHPLSSRHSRDYRVEMSPRVSVSVSADGDARARATIERCASVSCDLSDNLVAVITPLLHPTPFLPTIQSKDINATVHNSIHFL